MPAHHAAQQDKTPIRVAALARRNALQPDTLDAASAAITLTVCQSPAFAAAHTVCCYMSVGKEIQTEAIIALALEQGKRIALPRMIFNERRLMLHEVKDLAHLVPARYDIPEPPSDAPRVDPHSVDLSLVPGVAFDVAGNRLGYGAGFYDELLSRGGGARMALAHSSQLVSCIPNSARDIPVDFIITELGTIDCARGRRPSDHLRLRNLQCYGYHGAFPQERAQGVRLAFDIDLRLDLQRAGMTDNLETTVNYPAVFRLIERVQSAREYHLLEALAEGVAKAILDEFVVVEDVTITVRKFNPPVGGLLDTFEVEITRVRGSDCAPATIATRCGNDLGANK